MFVWDRENNIKSKQKTNQEVNPILKDKIKKNQFKKKQKKLGSVRKLVNWVTNVSKPKLWTQSWTLLRLITFFY
jgi:hypothetical protein